MLNNSIKKYIIFIISFVISYSVAAIDLDNATLNEIHIALKNKKITSEQLVESYLERIEKNKALNAVVSIDDTALKNAKKWDKSGDKNSILGGIPFLVKDNYNVVNQPNTAGSIALQDNIAKYDAKVVELLKQQGAIVLGRTNMSELAASYGRFGYSSLAGQTLNPLNLQRDPSGSSSGSASAVAAHLAPFALGTDTTGSIRGPASVTGLIGYRPSMGLTSRTGVVPLSLTFDTIGPLVSSVEDLVIIMDIIAVEDTKDQASVFYYSTQSAPNFTRSLNEATLENKRLGYINNYSGANDEVDVIIEQSLIKMKGQGAEVIELSLPEEMASIGATVSSFIIAAEFKPQLETHLRTNNTTLNLSEIIKKLKADKENPHPINPKRLAALEQNMLNHDTNSSRYISLLNQHLPLMRAKLDSIKKQYRLDGFVFATRPCPAAPLPSIIDDSYQCRSQDLLEAGYIASLLGYPEISIPAGVTQSNIPVSLSFLGGFAQDVEMIQLGHAFEKLAHFSVEN